MADQADVETALTGLVGAALYPGGLSQPCAVPGAICRVYRGWPTPAALDADLAEGRVNVSIIAIAGSAEVTTRYPDRWCVVKPTTPLLVASTVNEATTFAGDATEGQLVALLVDGRAAVYRTQAGDTPASVAGAVAAELRQLAAAPWNGASASGATVTVPCARSVVARVVADQPAMRETRRQCERFRVTCWCPDPVARDAVGATIDAALSTIDFIGLPDASSGRLRFVGSEVSDRWQDAALYRRELTYSVDYATTIAAVFPRAIVTGTRVAPGAPMAIATALS
jgi:hypothetical protein